MPIFIYLYQLSVIGPATVDPNTLITRRATITCIFSFRPTTVLYYSSIINLVNGHKLDLISMSEKGTLYNIVLFDNFGYNRNLFMSMGNSEIVRF